MTQLSDYNQEQNPKTLIFPEYLKHLFFSFVCLFFSSGGHQMGFNNRPCLAIPFFLLKISMDGCSTIFMTGIIAVV